MAKTVACIIARTVSTRLPLKVLRHVNEKFSLLDFIIQRLKLVDEIDEIYICTSIEVVDDILEDVAIKNGVKIYRGSPDQVIERMLKVAAIEKADNVIRITGDNVLTSYEFINDQIKFLNESGLDYCRLINVPIGATAEVISVNALKDCYNSIDASVSEYLLLFIFNPDKYKCGVITIGDKDNSNYTLTVDTPNDLVRTKTILKYFSENNLLIRLSEIIDCINEYKIPNSIIKPIGEIKLPYNKSISFEEFQQDMKSRALKSKLLKLNG
ncbi:hypothetical protein N9515_00905 [Vicingaceae bacterium]|nr:hypothetical protein [Vicingaceae bacterium]